MNRRSFTTKALAGLAAIPLIGKLVEARPQATLGVGDFELIKDDLKGSYPALPSNWRIQQLGSQEVTVTFTIAYFDKYIRPLIEHDRIWEARPNLVDERGDHELRFRRYSLSEHGAEVGFVVVNCRDTEACRLHCAARGLRDELWPVFDVTNSRYI